MSKTHLVCARCGGDPATGAAVTWSGPATGHNTERRILCETCLGFMAMLLADSGHVNATDPVTAEGLAHISTCPACSAQFGANRFRPVPRDDEPTIITKQHVADRFARGGFVQ